MSFLRCRLQAHEPKRRESGVAGQRTIYVWATAQAFRYDEAVNTARTRVDIQATAQPPASVRYLKLLGDKCMIVVYMTVFQVVFVAALGYTVAAPAILRISLGFFLAAQLAFGLANWRQSRCAANIWAAI